MSNLHSLVCLLLVFVRAEVGQGVRTWQTNFNLHDPRNWSPRRPCPADRLVLRPVAPLVLQLDGATAARGLVLGGDLELVLPKDGSLQLTGVNHLATCSGQDVVFNHTRPLRWTDPSNWDGWTRATPDLERVPCTQEDVKFLPGTTFNIITPPTLKLAGLEINGEMIDAYDWNEQSQEVSGWQLHQSSGDVPVLEYSGTYCPEDMWCECGNNYLRPDVCTADCPLALCKQPIQPAGFCCPICGAYFLVRSKDQSKRHLTSAISSFLRGKGVTWHASKVEELIQIVMVEDGDYSGGIAGVADNLKVLIAKNHTRWSVERMYASGHVWYPTSFGQVAGHFLSLMVFASLTLAFIIVFYSKNWSWIRLSSSGGRPFVFARFENQSGELIVAHEQRQADPLSPRQAFDNPMYGATGQEERNVTVENPVYTELEDFPEVCSKVEKVSSPVPETEQC